MPADTLPVIDVADLGPAMLALTPMQRGFVVAKVYLGLGDAAAARAAGYKSARHHAYLIAHREDVQAAILEVGKTLLRAEGPRSILTMVAIRDNEQVKPHVRLHAAEMIANRAGFHVTTEHHLEVTHRLSETEQDRRILALCAELGMSPDEARKMLIAPAEMQRNAEGIFELATPVAEPTPRALALREARRRRRGMTREEIEADKARIQAERSERMKRERAEAEARREAEFVETDEPSPQPQKENTDE